MLTCATATLAEGTVFPTRPFILALAQLTGFRRPRRPPRRGLLMATRAPTIGQVAVAVAFAFSCFALLLFLWSTFGGPVPLKPEGYRVKVPVEESAQLAVESDVRIANVSSAR